MFSTLPDHYSEFIHWTWPQFEPYYQDLIERSLSADNAAAWLTDWSRIAKTVRETYARLELATTLNTADAEAEQHYNAFIGEVYPQVEAAEQKLKQQLLDSRLEPASFEIPLRNMRAEAALFREANLPLLVEDRKLGTEYNKIIGAQTVPWEGTRTHAAANSPHCAATRSGGARTCVAAGCGSLAGRSGRDQRSVDEDGSTAPADRAQCRLRRLSRISLARNAALRLHARRLRDVSRRD